jgi:hypothetical protein
MRLAAFTFWSTNNPLLAAAAAALELFLVKILTPTNFALDTYTNSR